MYDHSDYHLDMQEGDNIAYYMNQKLKAAGAYHATLDKKHPGILWHMIYFFSQYTGQVAHKFTDFTSIELALKMHKPRDLMLKHEGKTYYPHGIRQRKGGIKCFELGYDMQTCQQELLDVDTPFERIVAFSVRHYDSFGVKYTNAGSYRDYEKGGWYSTIKCYKLLGQIFAPETSMSDGVSYQVRNALGLARENFQL